MHPLPQTQQSRSYNSGATALCICHPSGYGSPIAELLERFRVVLPRGLHLKCIGPIEENLCCGGQTVHVGALTQ